MPPLRTSEFFKTRNSIREPLSSSVYESRMKSLVLEEKPGLTRISHLARLALLFFRIKQIRIL